MSSRGWGARRRAASPNSRVVSQVAALPYRVGQGGGLEILLVTTRGSGRWIIPKGNLMEGLQPYQAAEREAMEEGGVEGRIGAEPVGTFIYDKRRRDGSTVPCRVSVFPLAVERQHRWWPEMEGRQIGWFSPQEAAAAVVEADLSELLLRFREDAPPSERGP